MFMFYVSLFEQNLAFRVMRLWSLAPRVFDLKGLGAQWAEALLASSVMYKRHGGFARHTQLNR